jgi:TPR repeat protein
LLAHDPVQALGYYKQAAALGDTAAQFNLGFMHANAQGTDQNHQLALQYYRLAAGEGLLPSLAHEAATEHPV